jgi:hypothetical protein
MRGYAATGFGWVLTAAVFAASPGLSEDGPRIDTGYNSYGYPGMIDMPVAASRPDGELAFSVSSFAGQTRNTLTFQITPRLSGSFRYSKLENLLPGGTKALYDRSFSVHFRFADETAWRPALAVGLNDFLGTGVYSSEYVVATKTIGERLRVTGGLGWGRLGGSGGFTNPLSFISDRFETRPERDVGRGGDVESQVFFRGDAAVFGGIEWQATEKLRLTAEYSSDSHPAQFRGHLQGGPDDRYLAALSLRQRNRRADLDRAQPQDPPLPWRSGTGTAAGFPAGCSLCRGPVMDGAGRGERGLPHARGRGA